MNIGMLWFDNDPKEDLGVKILKAANYYQNKYGQNPNLCFVHPSMLDQKKQAVAGFEIRPSKKILPNHLWLGISKQSHASV